LSTRIALKAAGVGILATEAANVVEGNVGLAFEARAVATVRLSLVSEIMYTDTYIQSFEFTAKDEDDDVIFGPEVIGELGPLSPPFDLVVVEGDEELTLTWDDYGSAESFNLYWSLISPVDIDTATQIEDVTSPYIHTGLTNETEYFYAVTSVNARLGESALSTEASGTPEEPELP
jgi:hypothetical protein